MILAAGGGAVRFFLDFVHHEMSIKLTKYSASRIQPKGGSQRCSPRFKEVLHCLTIFVSQNLEASTGSRLIRTAQSIPDLPYDRELAILRSAAY